MKPWNKFRLPNFLVKHEPAIGLDIGTSLIKMVELEKKGNVLRLKKFALSPLAAGENSALWLKEFVKLNIPPGRPVNISLAGQAVIIRYITWPKMTLNELKSALQFEAREYLPFPLEEMILDCAIVKDNIENNKMLIALAAIKKKAVEERLNLLEQAGLIAQTIDVDCFCLANAFNNSYSAPSSPLKPETIALLNVGAHSTNMVILQDGLLRFSRDIAFGGLEVTRVN